MEPYQLALKYYGMREIVGGMHNDKILEMFKYIGHSWVHDDETAWCACFINYCLKKSGYLNTGKLNARSFLDLPNAIVQPQLGDIMIFWRVAPDTVYGHVGFFINELWEDPDGYFILSGNQNNQVNIMEYPKLRLLGIRRPLKKK